MQRQNYELLRRGDSPPRRSNSLDRGPCEGGSSTSSSSSGGSSTQKGALHGGSKHFVHAPLGAPHGGGVSASPSSSSLSKFDANLGAYHGHKPSFRVIGVQISHLSRTGQFVFCTFGVFFFLLIYGFLQVRWMFCACRSHPTSLYNTHTY